MNYDAMPVGGKFLVRHFRDGKLIHEEESPNIVPIEGLDYTLNVATRGSTQISSWYVTLFDSNTTPASGNTAAQFFGTDGHNELYEITETNRPAWTLDAPVNGNPSGRTVANSTTNATFTCDTITNGSGTVYGAAIFSANVKSALAGSPGANDGTATLLAASRFLTSRSILAGDVLKVEYSLTAAST